MKTETKLTRVESRHWGPDDDYEVVEVQVFDIPKGTPVRVTITPISQEEYDQYLAGETDSSGGTPA
jgi:hypothetical protein